MSVKVKKLYTNNNSIYIIDEDNNLYVSGNNKNGRLGINSPLDFIKKITKVEDENLVENIKSLIIDENLEKKYSLVRILTLDNKIYVAGTSGDRDYIKWTPAEELYPNISESKFVPFTDTLQQKHTLEINVSEDWTYLFTIEADDKVFSSKIRMISVTDIIQVLLSCMNKTTDFFFTEYSVTTKKGYEFKVEKVSDTNRRVYLKIIPNNNEFNDTILSEILKIDVENIFSKITYEDELEENNNTYEFVTQKFKPESAVFSASKNNVTIDSITDDIFNMISIDAKIKDGTSSDIPFEGENYKDPYWMYTVFKKMGVVPNKLYKFEGSIMRNGIVYAVSNIRISDVIDTTPEGAEIGIVQFILSNFQKVEEFEIIADESRIPAITFYPILVDTSNEEDEYIHYKYHDSVENNDTIPLGIIEDKNEDDEVEAISIVYELKGILCGKNLTPIDFSQVYVTK